MALQLSQSGSDVLVPVKVVPKSSRDRIVGELDGALKISVSAAPEKGAANKAVRRLLATALGVRVQHITVESGHGSPRKWIRVQNLRAQDVVRVLAAAGHLALPGDRTGSRPAAP